MKIVSLIFVALFISTNASALEVIYKNNSELSANKELKEALVKVIKTCDWAKAPKRVFEVKSSVTTEDKMDNDLFVKAELSYETYDSDGYHPLNKSIKTNFIFTDNMRGDRIILVENLICQ